MRRLSIAVAALALALSHVVWPSRVQIDWPTIALLAIFVGMIFGPELSSVLPLIKRLKIGQAEIEMRETVVKLHEDVEKAEGLPFSQTEPSAAQETDPQVRVPDTNLEEKILDLAARDKESAVVRLAIEIERELFSSLGRIGTSSPSTRTIQGAVHQLVSRGHIPSEVGKAIMDFRNVRNRIIHPAREEVVPQSVVTSAIDS